MNSRAPVSTSSGVLAGARWASVASMLGRLCSRPPLGASPPSDDPPPASVATAGTSSLPDGSSAARLMSDPEVTPPSCAGGYRVVGRVTTVRERQRHVQREAPGFEALHHWPQSRQRVWP